MQAGALNIVPKWQSNDKYRTQPGFSALEQRLMMLCCEMRQKDVK